MKCRGERARPHPYPHERVIDSLQRRVVIILRQLLATAQAVYPWRDRHRRHQSHPPLQTPMKPGAHARGSHRRLFIIPSMCILSFSIIPT
jgi:hypothetical protein